MGQEIGDVRMKFEKVELPKLDVEFIKFAYWLRDVGEILPNSMIQLFENPEPHQKLWNAWVHYHREGYEDWQIEHLLTNHESGGWITDNQA